MKIGPGVSELWRVENRPLPLTWPMAYTTACTTVQAVIPRINITFEMCVLLQIFFAATLPNIFKDRSTIRRVIAKIKWMPVFLNTV